MSLDIHSAVTISAILSLLLGLSLRYVLADYPALLRPGLSMWIVSMFVQTAAWVLYGMRGALPDIATIVLSNALLGLSYACQQHALRRFLGRTRSIGVYLPVVLIALLEWIFTFWIPSIRGRTVWVSLVIAFLLGSCVSVLVRSVRPLPRSYSLTVVAFAVPATILILRAAYEGTRAEALSSAFAASPVQMIVFGMAAFMPLLATLGFVSMCNERLNRELTRQAMLDPLTGISNRRAMGEAGGRALATRAGSSVAALLVDADHFKKINDQYGHDAGDSALCALVAALQEGLREGEQLGRLGGEEFIVLLPGADEVRATVTAERLRRSVEAARFSIQREVVPLRVSVGTAVLEDGDDFVSLLRRADQAMYFAKRRGRNCVVGPRQMRLARAGGDHHHHGSDASTGIAGTDGAPGSLSTEAR